MCGAATRSAQPEIPLLAAVVSADFPQPRSCFTCPTTQAQQWPSQIPDHLQRNWSMLGSSWFRLCHFQIVSATDWAGGGGDRTVWAKTPTKNVF
jgi:hypothetical protein